MRRAIIAKLGYTSLTKALIVTKGIDVNIKDKNKKTPLHLALMNGHADVVESLVRNGANINIKDDYGVTPLSFIFGYSKRLCIYSAKKT